MKSIRYRIMIALFLGILSCVSLWGQDINFTPTKPDGPAKIQSSLWDLAAPRAGKSISGLQDTVVVTLVPPHGELSAAIDTSSLVALGGKVLVQSRSLMQVAVPAPSLLAVSELSGVGFVRRPIRPHAQQTWSEGRRLIRASDNYVRGVRGQGVKVGVIDGGVSGADELSNRDLSRWGWRNYTGEGIYAGDDVHGTACAEIVYDVAPEAELYLYKVDDLVDLENAKDRAIRDGIDIISHSLGWLGTGIGDGRGRACDIVNDAADNGILWVDAAGNDAKSHYFGDWSDFDSDNWHNFRGEDEVINFEAEAGDEITIFLTWNDWPVSYQDYDLYLYFTNSSGDPEVVDRSIDRQSSSSRNPPVESIQIEAERSGEYGIVVRSWDARPRKLKIWSSHKFKEYAVARNSIGSPADARGAMSVGAVQHDVYNIGRVASYSSRGPTIDGRFKPELVAPSGVSTVSYGRSTNFSYGYSGTSAAAPHVAGAAALIKSANPSYSRTQLWNALIAATVDIGTRGRDNDSGYGKLVLPLMQVAASTPQITSISPSARYNQVITIRGTNFGANRGASRVTFNGISSLSSSQYVSWSNTRIQVRVPTGARTGSVQVITANGRATARLTITSPWVRSISPQSGRSGAVVTINGENFGSSQGSRSVRFGSFIIYSFASWSNTAIRFRIPVNTSSGNVSVVTPEGVSNSVRLENISPYLTRISPTQAQTGDRLTLTGGNFGTRRGTGYVLFSSNVRPSASDYVSWSNSRIVVEIPARAQSGNVRVATSNGPSGTKLLIIESGPQITSISPSRVRYNQVITIRGTKFGANRGTSRVTFNGISRLNSSQYVSWSNTRIQVRVPTGARTGNVQVITANGRATARLTIKSPWVRGISPQSGRANTLVTISGENFGFSRGSSSVRIGSSVVSSYVSWSNTSIRFRVPRNISSGNLTVRTSEGTSNSVYFRSLSPYVSSVSPRSGLANSTVTIYGRNFGSSRGSSSVYIGSSKVSSFISWSNTSIRFRVPSNIPSGNLTVRTSGGTSNSVYFRTTSPYLSSISPTSVYIGRELVLLGGNFGSRRGTGMVWFGSVRPSFSDYVSWSNNRIVVVVPSNAETGDVSVSVSTGSGRSGTKKLVVRRPSWESLPSQGIFGYDPPGITGNPKSVAFGFLGTDAGDGDVKVRWEVKSEAHVLILFNGVSLGTVLKSDDWQTVFTDIRGSDVVSGENVIEFFNNINQLRNDSYVRWRVRNVWLVDLPNAKPVVGVASGLGDPFPAPFNAEVTIPFALAEAGPVRLAVYNLMGQPVRVLAEGWSAAGAYQVRWDGRTASGAEAASGVYWAVLQVGEAVETAKLVLIR